MHVESRPEVTTIIIKMGLSVKGEWGHQQEGREKESI
jgi:hypothetical protein